MKRQFVFAAGIFFSSVALADVRLPAIFSDHMVLQRGATVPVWGWADPGEAVTVAIGGQVQKTQAGPEGKWMLRLTPINISDPLRLTVTGKNTLTVEDVLAGEVWLCSGQSNMGLRVKQAQNFEQEQAAANLPQIRTFITTAKYAKEPQADAQGKWVVASPETVGEFSATAYFFGRGLYRDLHVPVGLVNSSVGGTAIELWIDGDAQRKSPDLRDAMAAQDKVNREFDAAAATARYQTQLAKWKKAAAEAKAAGKEPPGRMPQDPVALQERKSGSGALYNGMIAPLVPYALRGAIWYQGEANSATEKAKAYRAQLSLLIQDWRARWGQGDFPVAWVQLPNFDAPGRNWPLMRESMLKTLAVPNTGMAIAIDVGEADNIHPKNKQEVGRRLSMWALGTVYGKPVATSGPLPAASEIKDSAVVVKFQHCDGGLVAKGGALRGFQIAGADKRWVAASAKIAGGTVVVSSPDVAQPVAVRYAWANNPDCNLYNGSDIPASPFRTDDWPETE